MEYSSNTVYLSVYENNRHAIQLYQQLGFRFNGEYDAKGERIMAYSYEKDKPLHGEAPNQLALPPVGAFFAMTVFCINTIFRL